MANQLSRMRLRPLRLAGATRRTVLTENPNAALFCGGPAWYLVRMQIAYPATISPGYKYYNNC